MKRQENVLLHYLVLVALLVVGFFIQWDEHIVNFYSSDWMLCQCECNQQQDSVGAAMALYVIRHKVLDIDIKF